MTVINTIALLGERKEDDFEQDLYCCLFFHILRKLRIDSSRDRKPDIGCQLQSGRGSNDCEIR